MKLTDMKIGVRLGAGFGVVLLLMAVLVLTGLLRLDKIGALSDAIIERDWAKADAIATVRSTTRSNAALVLELFIHEDPARAAAIHAEIDTNKATITKALEILDRLIVLPEAKELLATLQLENVAIETFSCFRASEGSCQRSKASACAVAGNEAGGAVAEVNSYHLVQLGHMLPLLSIRAASRSLNRIQSTLRRLSAFCLRLIADVCRPNLQ